MVVSGGYIMVAIVDVGASYELEPLICAKWLGVSKEGTKKNNGPFWHNGNRMEMSICDI